MDDWGKWCLYLFGFQPPNAKSDMICYKFTTAQYAFFTLFDRRMKASRPNEFNDIFEFCPVSDPSSLVRRTMIDCTWARGFYEIAKKNGYSESFDYFRANDLETIASKNLDLDNLAKWDLKAREAASKYVGIICLSICSPVSRRSPVSLLWSHYADSHKGCAIGVNVWHECFKHAGARLNDKVNYIRERPGYFWDLEVHDKPKHLRQLYEISKTKSDVWAYEREYRLAFPITEVEQRGIHCFVPIHPQAVRRVVYGERIDVEFMGRIESILQQPDFSHVRRFQIQRDPYSYSLRLVQPRILPAE
jgi:hypothetical protein